MVVEVIDGAYEEPVFNTVPPDDVSNHCNDPLLAVAPSVTIPSPQRAAGLLLVTEGVLLTVAVTLVRADVQPL